MKFTLYTKSYAINSKELNELDKHLKKHLSDNEYNIIMSIILEHAHPVF